MTTSTSGFADVDFRGVDLSRADLRASIFERVDFRDAILRDVDLRRATFRQCTFAGADLTGAKLSRHFGWLTRLSRAQRAAVSWQWFGALPDGG